MKQRFGTLVGLMFLAGSLSAQSDDDIFADGAFDQAVAEGQAQEDTNKLSWLGGVNLASTNSVALPANGGYLSQSSLTGKGFLKATNPSVGALFLAYSFNHWLWAATDRDALGASLTRGKSLSASPEFTLSEVHVSFDLGKVVFLRLGNQLIDWGASAVWSPADFINRRSSSPDAPIDSRIGKPGVRAHIPWSAGNFFVFVDASRSLTATGQPRNLLETGTVGLKADVTWFGWNLGVVGNFGKDSDPRSGFTATGSLAGVDVWGEAGAVLPLGDRDLSWSTSWGGEKSFGTDAEWTLRAEGFWNPNGREGEILESDRAQFTPYYWGRAYVYGELLKKKLWGPDVTGSVSATANLADQSWTSTASLRTSFPGTIPLNFYVQHNGGEANREFTLSTNGPAWTLGLRSVLEF